MELLAHAHSTQTHARAAATAAAAASGATGPKVEEECYTSSVGLPVWLVAPWLARFIASLLRPCNRPSSKASSRPSIAAAAGERAACGEAAGRARGSSGDPALVGVRCPCLSIVTMPSSGRRLLPGEVGRRPPVSSRASLESRQPMTVFEDSLRRVYGELTRELSNRSPSTRLAASVAASFLASAVRAPQESSARAT